MQNQNFDTCGIGLLEIELICKVTFVLSIAIGKVIVCIKINACSQINLYFQISKYRTMLCTFYGDFLLHSYVFRRWGKLAAKIVFLMINLESRGAFPPPKRQLVHLEIT